MWSLSSDGCLEDMVFALDSIVSSPWSERIVDHVHAAAPSLDGIWTLVQLSSKSSAVAADATSYRGRSLASGFLSLIFYGGHCGWLPGREVHTHRKI